MAALDEIQCLLPLQRKRGRSPGGREENRPGQKWGVAPWVILTLAGLLVCVALFSLRSTGSQNTPDEDIQLYHESADTARNPGSTGPSSDLPVASPRGGFVDTQHAAEIVSRSDDRNSNKLGSASVEGGQPPNVIFIMIDDVGMNDIGLESTDLAQITPFIDSLIQGGVHLTKYYTNHFCTPSRASLMTGRDTFLTGMQFGELESTHPWGLPVEEATLANRFKAAGYSTHMAGKWNLGMFTEAHYPFNRGFDTFLGYLGAMETYYTHSNGDWKDFGYGDEGGYLNTALNSTRKGPGSFGIYSTTLTANRALDIASEHISSGTDNPLFLYLAFQAAHFPLEDPPDAMFTPEQHEVLSKVSQEVPVRLAFAKILYFLDIALKRMVEELDAMGMMDNTLLALASDNGACATYGGSNYPFRGFKTTLFEGGVRTPALVYSKSESIIPLKARGTKYDGMMHVMDWTPTLASITGIPLEGMGLPLSGFNQWPGIVGDTSKDDSPIRNDLVLGFNSYVYDSAKESVVNTSQPRGGYISRGWKIIVGDRCTGWFSFNPSDNLLFDVMCDVGECPTCDGGCMYENSHNNSFLFHIESDPFEKVNLIKSMPDKFADMVNQWTEASADEVKSNYEPHSQEAAQAWKNFNYWVVSWE